MIYLVTNAPDLIKSELYTNISVQKSLELLDPLTIVSADTETMGLDVFTNKLLSLQLGNADFQIVIDCLTIDIQQYKTYLESERTFIFWNAQFDLKFLYYQNIFPNTVWDGFLAEQLLWLGVPPGIHEKSLKAAGMHYLNIELDKTVRGQIVSKGLTESVVVYAALDVKYLEPIREKQIKYLTEKGLLRAIKVENEFVKCLAYIEFCGVKLDRKKWSNKVAGDLERCETKVQELNSWVVNNMGGQFVTVNNQGDLFTGFDTTPQCVINWKSPKQVIPLFEKLGLNLTVLDKKTKKQKKSTDIKVIEPQATKSTLIPIFIEYKKLAILVDTFGEKFLKLINPVTQRIHANFWQLGTDTARLSSSNPNMQNLPSDSITRSCFIAEKDHKWISCDYKGQENFIMADIANDAAMINELMCGSGDLHSVAAKMIFKDQIPADTPLTDIPLKFKELRQQAKGYEFCFNYGGTDITLVRNYGITAIRAKEIYQNYMAGFIGLQRYQKWARHEVMQRGYIELSPLTGHRAFIYDFSELQHLQKKQHERGFWEYYRQLKAGSPNCDTVQNVRKLASRRAECEKRSINYRIQGTGALMFKFASIFLFQYIMNNNLFGIVKYCIPVHDEINVEAPKDMAQEIGKVVVACMERAGAYFCKKVVLGADMTLNDYWEH